MPSIRTNPTGSLHDIVDVVRFEHAGLESVLVTVLPGPADSIASLILRLQHVLEELDAAVLEMRFFAPRSSMPECRDRVAATFAPNDWPVTFVLSGEGPKPCGGIQVWAVSGAQVRTVRVADRPVGRLFEDEWARYLVLGDLRPSDVAVARTEQAADTIGLLENALGHAAMDFGNLVRTWFFIDDIVDWYVAFNEVRSAVYGRRGLFDRYIPASTGIGGGNPYGAALAASAFAIEPKPGNRVTVREVPSPLQCPARDYGSSFSRAAEVETPGWRSLLVSGTASIDADGNTAFHGDVDAQVARTLDVIGAILESRGMSFADVIRANAYFRRPEDTAAISGHVARRGLPATRLVVSHNAVCRDDLLFEMEVDAVRMEPGAGRGIRKRISFGA